VRERAMLRELIRIGGEIATSAYQPEGRDASQLVDEAERQVFEIAEQGKRRGSGLPAAEAHPRQDH
jgi:replicative DNA helicase